VARLYGDLVSTFVVDRADAGTPGAVTADIVMVDPEGRAEVGRRLLEVLR
jgi:hypothetical protein